MDIRTYMINEAEKITNRPLPTFNKLEEFEVWRKQQQQRYFHMIGIDRYLQQPRTDLNLKVTGTIQHEHYWIEKFYFESLPGLYVAGNLYVPKNADKPVPAILHSCGHSEDQKVVSQVHARKYAQIGFVCLIIDTIELGEAHGMHRGTQRYGHYDWISRGYSSLAAEVWNGIRAIDILTAHPSVDANRIGLTGHSGGGAISWWLACADDRIQAVAPSSGTSTIASHIKDRTIDLHCDCYFPVNPYGLSLLELSAIVAPRPVLIVAPNRDLYFNCEGTREFYRRFKSFYEQLGISDRVDMFEFEFYHGYSKESRTKVYSWFYHQFTGQEVTPEQIGDVDDHRETKEDLLVFPEGAPANDRSTSVHHWWVSTPEPPKITSREQFESVKASYLNDLRQESFQGFPDKTIELQHAVDQKVYTKQMHYLHHFSYQSDESWRVYGRLNGRLDDNMQYPKEPTPVVVEIPSRVDHGTPYLNSMKKPYLTARLEVRGTGYTSWGASNDMDKHIRRSLSLIGKTLCQERVWDTLRGLQAIRMLPEVDKNKIYLAGEGEMAVVALYAALLDDDVAGVILHDPPSSHKENSSGHIELINVLRILDLPMAAALLWPKHIIFNGFHIPESYQRTEEIYRSLGAPGAIWRSVQDWPQN